MGEVLVVPPFDCAWLTGEGVARPNEGGCLSFEAKARTDITVILKAATEVRVLYTLYPLPTLCPKT